MIKLERKRPNHGARHDDSYDVETLLAALEPALAREARDFVRG